MGHRGSVGHRGSRRKISLRVGRIIHIITRLTLAEVEEEERKTKFIHLSDRSREEQRSETSLTALPFHQAEAYVQHSDGQPGENCSRTWWC